MRIMNLSSGPDDRSPTRMSSEHDHHHHDLMHCSPSARFRFLGSDGQRQLTDDQSINQSGARQPAAATLHSTPLPPTPCSPAHGRGCSSGCSSYASHPRPTWMRPKPWRAPCLHTYLCTAAHRTKPHRQHVPSRHGAAKATIPFFLPLAATRPSADPRRGEARGTTGGQGHPGRRSSSVECPRDRGSDRLDGDYQT